MKSPDADPRLVTVPVRVFFWSEENGGTITPANIDLPVDEDVAAAHSDGSWKDGELEKEMGLVPASCHADAGGGPLCVRVRKFAPGFEGPLWSFFLGVGECGRELPYHRWGFELALEVRWQEASSGLIFVPSWDAAHRFIYGLAPPELKLRDCSFSRCRQAWLEECDTAILDCFMESGIMGAAAIGLGHRFIGFERDPQHRVTAVWRLASERILYDYFGGDGNAS